MEQLIIAVVFSGALVYLGRMIYRQFSAKNAGCAKNCGACSVEFKIPERVEN